MYTRNTAGTGCGMPRCAKIHYRTRTHVTCFGNTAGLPAPVLNLTWIKLNKVDAEGDLLNLSRNVLKIAYLRPQGALSLVKYVVKAPNRGKFA